MQQSLLRSTQEKENFYSPSVVVSATLDYQGRNQANRSFCYWRSNRCQIHPQLDCRRNNSSHWYCRYFQVCCICRRIHQHSIWCSRILYLQSNRRYCTLHVPRNGINQICCIGSQDSQCFCLQRRCQGLSYQILPWIWCYHCTWSNRRKHSKSIRGYWCYQHSIWFCRILHCQSRRYYYAIRYSWYCRYETNPGIARLVLALCSQLTWRRVISFQSTYLLKNPKDSSNWKVLPQSRSLFHTKDLELSPSRTEERRTFAHQTEGTVTLSGVASTQEPEVISDLDLCSRSSKQHLLSDLLRLLAQFSSILLASLYSEQLKHTKEQEVCSQPSPLENPEHTNFQSILFLTLYSRVLQELKIHSCIRSDKPTSFSGLGNPSPQGIRRRCSSQDIWRICTEIRYSRNKSRRNVNLRGAATFLITNAFQTDTLFDLVGVAKVNLSPAFAGSGTIFTFVSTTEIGPDGEFEGVEQSALRGESIDKKVNVAQNALTDGLSNSINTISNHNLFHDHPGTI